MEPSNRRGIINMIQQRSCFFKKGKRLLETVRVDFNGGAVYQNPQFVGWICCAAQGFLKPDASFIQGAFTPITDGQVALCFGNLLLITKSFESTKAFADQILGELLGA